ncbi:hypothetical protein GP486_006421 [Trichoglossum hirsutum]|uniref:Origin recognition complex subunit 1 n=1 Tax=Trichoglossum hirsutum TaxID=265104 RepID=A0A9P8IEI3_9PEZI|nr:hypothetical protein GP486_006421 [Trichoglossum hirsutum]
MAVQRAPAPPSDVRAKRSKAERARRYLSGFGVAREDSDDELGLEDHPWNWIYEETTEASDCNGRTEDLSCSDGDDELVVSTLNRQVSGRKRRAPCSERGRIVGARMGDFQCKIGDCVLLKADGTNEAWVGLICAFEDEEDDGKAANFMWFSTEKEIRNKQKKRTDFMQNELYITPSWDINPITSINGKATVMSPKKFLSKYPDGRVPRSSRDYGKIFVCRRGCNTRTATYTEEFVWEDIYEGHEEDIFALIERVQSETKATRKRRGEEGKEYEPHLEGDGYNELPSTPRKKRKLSSASTPKSRRSATTPRKLTTPTHKRIAIMKPLEFTPLGTRILSPSHISSSPFQIARARLHVSSVPATLPCREQEFATVYSHLEAAISDGSGSCIYISGTPGTGKTATVREVVSHLNDAVLNDELDDFIFVEINGMKVTDPHQSYSLLWEALKGDRVSPSHALDLLEREFGNPSPRRVPCVVLMDELDQLVTKNQSVMYNFFNWPGLSHSRLIVLAVANTMDLPERTLSNKISSRLGLTRITFPGYNHEQLMKIIQSRLEGVPGNIVDSDAVQFASRKVAAVSGDARRALDICRRAVEIAELEGQNDNDSFPPTPSKRAKDDTSRRPNGGDKMGGRVTIATIKQAINEATTSPLQQYLRSLPLSAKLCLAALVARVRRTGITESVMGDVIDEAKRIAKMADSQAVREFLLEGPLAAAVAAAATAASRNHTAAPPKAARGGNTRLPAARVQGLSAATAELTDAGVIGVAGRGERTAKVRLVISVEEVRLALKDDLDARCLGFST